jgi:hypothetical protein
MKHDDSQTLNRRRVFAGAGTAGALAAAAAVLPLARPDADAPARDAGQAGEADGRYQETAHVLHYYQTAKV